MVCQNMIVNDLEVLFTLFNDWPSTIIKQIGLLNELFDN